MRLSFLPLLALVFWMNIKANPDKRVTLDVIKHHSCPWNTRTSRWVEKIVFPNSNYSNLQSDVQNPGCYWIGGNVFVNEELKGGLQIHVDIRNRLAGIGPSERCLEAEKQTGCGGFGSCLYCDLCQTLEESKRRTRVHVSVNGKSTNCGKVLPPGNHENINLYFCLPTKKEFLRMQGVNPQVWDHFQRRTNGARNRMGVIVTMRIFNSRVDKLMRAQTTLEDMFRTANKLSPRQNLPMSIYRLLPFNRLIQSNSGFIGCHKVYGYIYVDDSDFRS